MLELLPGISGLSRQVVSRGSGLKTGFTVTSILICILKFYISVNMRCYGVQQFLNVYVVVYNLTFLKIIHRILDSNGIDLDKFQWHISVYTLNTLTYIL